MIVLGGSSMHKGANGWQAGARDRLPAGADRQRRDPGRRFWAASWQRRAWTWPRQHHRTRTQNARAGYSQPDVGRDGGPARRRIRTLLLMGTNMLSSYADAGDAGAGPATHPAGGQL